MGEIDFEANELYLLQFLVNRERDTQFNRVFAEAGTQGEVAARMNVDFMDKLYDKIKNAYLQKLPPPEDKNEEEKPDSQKEASPESKEPDEAPAIDVG